MPQKTKTLTGVKVEVKDAEQGLVRAVFSTFNVIDLDGDVTLAGAFTDGQKVRISAYNHTSWSGALPVGKGVVHADETEAWVDAQFFLNTQAGHDTFEVVKAMEDLQEWSYGYDIDEAYPGQQEGQDVQFLAKLEVHEVSPVLLGAGINTRTLAVKGKQLNSDVFDQLRELGIERYASETTYVYVDDYDLDEGYVVYDVCSPTEERDLLVELLRGADGTIALGQGETEVEEVTTYEPKARRTRWPAAGESETDALVAKARARRAGALGDGEPAADAAEMLKAQADQLSRLLDLAKSEDKVLGAALADYVKGALAESAAAADPAKGMKLSDHLAAVAADVDEVQTRLADVMAMRADEGKSLGELSREGAADLADRLDTAAKALREVVTSAEEDERHLTLEDETALAETLARHGLSI